MSSFRRYKSREVKRVCVALNQGYSLPSLPLQPHKRAGKRPINDQGGNLLHSTYSLYKHLYLLSATTQHLQKAGVESL